MEEGYERRLNGDLHGKRRPTTCLLWLSMPFRS